MKQILLDGAALTTRAQIHQTLAEALDFPPYYGGNLDALYDCLTDLPLPVRIDLVNTDALEQSLNHWANALRQTLTEAAAENPNLTVTETAGPLPEPTRKEGTAMIPTPAQARELLLQYNQGEFHVKHGYIVGDVLRWYAEQLGYADEADFWQAVGILHDLDFEQWPDQHCVKSVELMQQHGLDQRLIRAAASHGWGMTASVYQPEHTMEKVLFAVDELTGLIGAAAAMRPSKSVSDLELKSLKKKYKDKRFAAGCSREVIAQGAEQLGWTLDELLEKTILAMRASENAD